MDSQNDEIETQSKIRPSLEKSWAGAGCRMQTHLHLHLHLQSHLQSHLHLHLHLHHEEGRAVTNWLGRCKWVRL